MHLLFLFFIVIILLIVVYCYVDSLIDPLKYKWKYYSKMLYTRSIYSSPEKAPEEDNRIEYLLQVANDWKENSNFGPYYYSGCRCFEYDGIKYYVGKYTGDEPLMFIEVIKENKSLYVFSDGKWLHKGSWCIKINSTLIDIDNRIKVKIKQKKNKEQDEIDDDVNFFREDNERKRKNQKRIVEHREDENINKNIKKRLSTIRENGD